MSTQRDTYLAPEEYLAIERKAEYKSEYMDGIVYDMSGASLRHNTIVANVIGALGQQLRERPGLVLASHIKVLMPDSRKFFYPDVSVLCGEPQFHDDREDIILNPTLIVEVLSESTAAFDRGEKFRAYQQLVSLQEYILISQDESAIEQYVRQTQESWTYTTALGMDSTLNLPSIECTLSLQAVYDKTG
ncbi:MAG TPA: Uma2 family endonuclease [Pyrinomonadaceae bacterium]|jgi:Uma2 family endonuclease|nr:Uma2 family endonuclease [Pyrinomonadaceae bacterium]